MMTVETVFRFKARHPADFSAFETSCDSEREAKKKAEHYFARGYDVQVTAVATEVLADWKHEK